MVIEPITANKLEGENEDDADDDDEDADDDDDNDDDDDEEDDDGQVDCRSGVSSTTRAPPPWPGGVSLWRQIHHS